MADSEPAADNAPRQLSGMSHEELEFRRYEARLGVWKVVLGTFIIGLAGVLIPGAINLTTLLFDNWRKQAEFQLAQQSAHEQYIKDFFDTAVNQDIELRIRFATYFAELSDENQQGPWTRYRNALMTDRQTKRELINKLEADLVELKSQPELKLDVAELDRTVRELNWAYAEIGYVQPGRSAVRVIAGKKERLYGETVAVVDRLATLQTPIDGKSADYLRFWELYWKELIGVESPSFSSKMVAIGKVLTELARTQALPNDTLKTLSAELAELARQEVDDDARAPAAAAN